MIFKIETGNRIYTVTILPDGTAYTDKPLPKSRKSEIEQKAQSIFDRTDPTVCEKCGNPTGFVVTTGWGSIGGHFGMGNLKRTLSCGDCHIETPFKTPKLHGFTVKTESPMQDSGYKFPNVSSVVTDYPMVGREWDTIKGKRSITGFDTKAGRYLVVYESQKLPILILPEDIEEEIAIDCDILADSKKIRQRARWTPQEVAAERDSNYQREIGLECVNQIIKQDYPGVMKFRNLVDYLSVGDPAAARYGTSADARIVIDLLHEYSVGAWKSDSHVAYWKSKFPLPTVYSQYLASVTR